MRKVLYRTFLGTILTAGARDFLAKHQRNISKNVQRSQLRKLFADFSPNTWKRYHVSVRFYLRPKRIHNNVDNLLKEFNDCVFGKDKDQLIFSLTASKHKNTQEHIQIWIYELP